MSKRTGSAAARPSVSKAMSSAPTRTRGMDRLCYGRPRHVKFTALTPELYDYVVAHNPAPDAVLRDLATETAALGPMSLMQVSIEQGAFLTLLARMLGARRAVEVGTFTGYSAISITRGLV